MQLKKKDAAKVFRKLNVESRSSTHHVAGVARIDGVLAVPVYFSNGRGDMPGNVGHYFRRSLFMSVAEFDRLVKCSMSRDEWADLARKRIQSPAEF